MFVSAVPSTSVDTSLVCPTERAIVGCVRNEGCTTMVPKFGAEEFTKVVVKAVLLENCGESTGANARATQRLVFPCRGWSPGKGMIATQWL